MEWRFGRGSCGAGKFLISFFASSFSLTRRNQMLREWIMGEHHRLHIVEERPDGPYKEAALTAIRSILDSLLLDFRAAISHPVCAICHNRKRATAVFVPCGASAARSL